VLYFRRSRKLNSFSKELVGIPHNFTDEEEPMNDRIYFPGLNGIRFLAALSVVIVHIEQFKGFFGLNEQGSTNFFLFNFVLSGRDAVTLFFVLSGFLITYLLLTEYRVTSTIAVRKFYARRMLRIWPLYYFIVFLSFVVVTAVYHITDFDGYYMSIRDQFWLKLGLFIAFIPNIANLMGQYVVGAMHLWSIGVEEQFYIIWPLLMKRFARRPLLCLLGVIAFKAFFIVFNIIVRDNPMPFGMEFIRPVFIFFYDFRIESMAIGGVGAYFLFNKYDRLLSVLFHPIVEKLILVLVVLNFTVLRSTGMPGDVALSVLYVLFILNVSSNPRSTIQLENRIFNELGKFSYGIYMYHPIVIYFTLIAFHLIGFTNSSQLIYNPIIYLLVIGLTIGVAALSYYKFEMRFLRLKSRLMVIRSGDATLSPPAAPQLSVK
jgi:peptidoglycan/LPS O-acetylase OafA/YrhL